MERKTTSGWIALTLVIVSIIILFLPFSLPQTAPALPTDGFIELASLGRDEVISLRAEIVEGGESGAEMVIYSTGSASLGGDTDRQVTLDLPDGETVTLQGADLAKGKRFRLSEQTAGYFRAQSGSEREGVLPRLVGVQAFDLDLPVDSNARELRIALQDMDLVEVPGEAAEGPPSTEILLTFHAEDCRYDAQGGWEVPLYVLAKKRDQDSGELKATLARETMSILVEAPGVEPRTLTIEAGHPRSTEAIALPLLRSKDRKVTATDLAGKATAAKLTLSWQAHGPNLVLKVYPSEAEGYATQLSPIRLYALVERDEKILRPEEPMRLLVSDSKSLTVEPAEATLDTVGEPVALKVFGHDGGTEALKLHVPKLDLDAEVTVRFRRPYLFLGLAALFGALGVIAARRRHLFEQGRWALALELLAAVTGGTLLYAAFLMQWLPTPGYLIGAMPASAVGILGGYAGEAVFQALLRVLGLAK